MPSVTHTVLNQARPLAGHDLFETDRGLRDALEFNAPGNDTSSLSRLGRLLVTDEMQGHARLANLHPPMLQTHDRFGHRVDTVEFHPSYHALLGAAIGAGLHATPWAGTPSDDVAGQCSPKVDAPHTLRAAGFLMFAQLEHSVLCPVSMTYAVTPALRGNPALFGAWFDQLASTSYDPRAVAIEAKRGATMGMGMTEKQGGSDVRANTTGAEFVGDDAEGRCFRLVGHKWFFSAPMSDAFLVLAQTAAGLSCFFMPRLLADGRRNGIAIQRLKDKLGNHANASAEVEFDGSLAWLVGEEGRGIQQILEMGTLTRLDCALGTAGLMRGAVALALHHCTQRSAFGKPLIDQPLMRNVVADLAIESEAATALALRLARSIDRQHDPFEGLMRRVLTPVAKFWICKRGAALAQEAMECLGGNGYVEAHGEGVMARIYREMPLNSIWEGAGNIMALDLMRTVGKRDPFANDGVGALREELGTARGSHPAFDRFTEALLARLDDAQGADGESGARRLATDIALAVQASLLHRHAPDFMFQAFCRSRLACGAPAVFGTLPSGIDLTAILQRARPD